MYLWFYRRQDRYQTWKWFFLTGWAICMQSAWKHVRRRNPPWMIWWSLKSASLCLYYAVKTRKMHGRKIWIYKTVQ